MFITVQSTEREFNLAHGIEISTSDSTNNDNNDETITSDTAVNHKKQRHDEEEEGNNDHITRHHTDDKEVKEEACHRIDQEQDGPASSLPCETVSVVTVTVPVPVDMTQNQLLFPTQSQNNIDESIHIHRTVDKSSDNSGIKIVDENEDEVQDSVHPKLYLRRVRMESEGQRQRQGDGEGQGEGEGVVSLSVQLPQIKRAMFEIDDNTLISQLQGKVSQELCVAPNLDDLDDIDDKDGEDSSVTLTSAADVVVMSQGIDLTSPEVAIQDEGRLEKPVEKRTSSIHTYILSSSEAT
eukprot:gene4975-9947_t